MVAEEFEVDILSSTDVCPGGTVVAQKKAIVMHIETDWSSKAQHKIDVCFPCGYGPGTLHAVWNPERQRIECHAP